MASLRFDTRRSLAGKARPANLPALRPRAIVRPRSAATSRSVNLKDYRVVTFSAKRYVLDFLQKRVTDVFPNSKFVEPGLDETTADLAKGCDAVCLFVNDDCNARVVEKLADHGVKMIALRCAGFDKVDLKACATAGIKVARVPVYSPTSVAEHALAMMMTLNRKLHLAHERVIAGNYALSGLVGFTMYGKTVGVIGTGAIGVQMCRILKGLGCNVIAHDVFPRSDITAMGIPYMSVEEMLPKCDIVTLHCPLLPDTHHIMDARHIAMLKPGAMLINVSRGGLCDSDALLDGLDNGQIGALGLDVYENEGKLFFEDWTKYDTAERMKHWDRRLSLLASYPEVLLSPHSAFLTKEALGNIGDTTMENLVAFFTGSQLANEVKLAPVPVPAGVVPARN